MPVALSPDAPVGHVCSQCPGEAWVDFNESVMPQPGMTLHFGRVDHPVHRVTLTPGNFTPLAKGSRTFKIPIDAGVIVYGQPVFAP